MYIVATPIGHLGDISARALAVLKSCRVIACEDTRTTRKLTHRFDIQTPLLTYHDHNAERVRPQLVERASREPIALVSDAGTPLISDPGFKLVRACKAANLLVTSIPGACAAITALTVSGLPSDRFYFVGFLPPKESQRKADLAMLANIPATLIVYESASRLSRTLATLAESFGLRPACIARELTKIHETLYDGTLPDLAQRFEHTEVKGEVVIVIGPPDAPSHTPSPEDIALALEAALKTHSLKQAVALVTAETGLPRKQVYAQALRLQHGS